MALGSATNEQAVALRDALQPLTGLTRLHIGPYLAFSRQQASTLLAGLSTMCKLRSVALNAIVTVPCMPAQLTQPWAAVSALAFDFSVEQAREPPHVAAAALRSWTASLPQLTSLSVNPELHCDRVLDAPVLSMLCSLRLRECAERDQDDRPLPLSSLHAMLAPATALVSLALSQLVISPAEVPALFALFAACTQLTRLRLDVGRWSADARWVDCVAQYVPAIPHLRHLSLRGCVLHRPTHSLSSSRALREALVGLTGLRELEITVAAAHLSLLVYALATRAQRLRHLRL